MLTAINSTSETERCSVKKRAVLWVCAMYSDSDLCVMALWRDAHLVAVLNNGGARSDDRFSGVQAAFCGNHIPVDVAQLYCPQASGFGVSTAFSNHHGEAIGDPRVANDRRQGNRQHGLLQLQTFERQRRDHSRFQSIMRVGYGHLDREDAALRIRCR